MPVFPPASKPWAPSPCRWINGLLARPARLAAWLVLILCVSCPSVGAIGAMAMEQPGRVRLAMDETAGSIAVIYPEVAEPYRSIFSQIIAGINEQAGAAVRGVPVGPTATSQDIADALMGQHVRVVIALGRNGLKMAGSLGHDVAVVGGCVISVPEDEARAETVFSLAPDPSLLFARLKALKPGVTRVHVVYDTTQSGWLIRRAKEVAQATGIQLIAREATDLKSALRIYQEVLAAMDPQQDSLWLPQDTTTVEESAVLPMLLQEAWTRGIVLFSSNIAHVRRGALFALYPNNRQLGRHLGSWAAGMAGAAPGGLVPLTDVMAAVNVRTAAHLGLQLSGEEERSFDLEFPEN